MTTQSTNTGLFGARQINLGTGQNAQGAVQSQGNLLDANWKLTSGGVVPEVAGEVFTDTPSNLDFGNGGWVANSTASTWVAPNPNSGVDNGNFTITDTFNLSASDAANAVFTGVAWAIDDSGSMVVNGHTVSTLVNGYTSMHSISVPTADLVTGSNSISLVGVGSDDEIEGSRMQGMLTIAAQEAPIVVGHGQTVNLTQTIDTLAAVSGEAASAITIASVTGNAVLSSGNVTYTAPASGTDSFVVTAQDSSGRSGAATMQITIDAGPKASNGSTEVAHNAVTDLTSFIDGLVTAGIAGDSETITSVSGGSVWLSNGHVYYTAQANGQSNFTYTVTDQYGDTASGTVGVNVDTGPTVAGTTRTINLATGQNAQGVLQTQGNAVDANWKLTAGGVAPEQAGSVFSDVPGNADFGGWVSNDSNSLWVAPNPTNADGNGNFTVTDTFTLTAGELASAQIANTAWAIDDSGTVVLNGHTIGSLTSGWTSMHALTLPTADLVAGTNTLSIIGSGSDDQIEGSRLAGTITVTDPQVTVTVGHNQSSDITQTILGMVTAGATGDTETVTAVSGGNTSVTNGHVTYAAGATGNATVNFTVTDQLGDNATGQIAVVVDAGPTASNGTDSLTTSGQTDLTSFVDGLITAGIQGDTETITAVNGAGVSVQNGHVIYSGAGTGSFTYTVADQYGDSATGTVSLLQQHADTKVVLDGYTNSVVAPQVVTPANGINGATITGPLFGNATTTGDADNRTIVAQAYNNTVIAGGGNDTIYAGLSGAKVTVSDGNGDNIVTGNGQVVGQTSVTLGSGNDQVDLIGYQNNISLGNGNDTVTGTVGLANITAGNGNDSITAVGYNNNITLGTGTSTIYAGNGNETLNLQGSATVVFDGFSNHLVDSAGNVSISGDYGSSTFDIAGSNNTLVLTGYNDVIHLGSAATGNNTVTGTLGLTTIITGNGNQTISAAGMDNVITVGDGNSTIDAGDGYAKVSVGTGINSIVADGNGNTIATAGGATIVSLADWNNTVDAGRGLTTVSGGLENTYVVTAIGNSGGLNVQDFNSAYGDVLDLRGLEASLGVGHSALSAHTDASDASALDIFITPTGGAATMVATLHGLNLNASLASLTASHSLLG
jgi:hypothetical protein